MKTPKTTITILRKSFYQPSQRKLTNILHEVNENLPNGDIFVIDKLQENKAVLQGNTNFAEDLINRLKQEALDFIVEKSGKDFQKTKIILDEEFVQLFQESKKIGKKCNSLVKAVEEVFI